MVRTVALPALTGRVVEAIGHGALAPAPPGEAEVPRARNWLLTLALRSCAVVLFRWGSTYVAECRRALSRGSGRPAKLTYGQLQSSSSASSTTSRPVS